MHVLDLTIVKLALYPLVFELLLALWIIGCGYFIRDSRESYGWFFKDWARDEQFTLIFLLFFWTVVIGLTHLSVTLYTLQLFKSYILNS